MAIVLIPKYIQYIFLLKILLFVRARLLVNAHRYKESILSTKLFLGFVNEYLYTSIKLFLSRRVYFSEATTIAKAIGAISRKSSKLFHHRSSAFILLPEFLDKLSHDLFPAVELLHHAECLCHI